MSVSGTQNVGTAGQTVAMDQEGVGQQVAIGNASLPTNVSVQYQSMAPAPPPASTSPSAAPSAANEREVARALRKEIDAEVQSRLSEDPEYKQLKELCDKAEAALKDLALVERHHLSAGDGKVDLNDLRAVMDDILRPPEVRAAARRLLENPEIWNAFAKDGVLASLSDANAAIAGFRTAIKTKEADVRREVREEFGSKSTSQTTQSGSGTSTVSGNTATPSGGATETGTKQDAIAAELDAVTPKPVPSTLGGLEGAYENSNNLLTWSESEMDRLQALFAKTDDPKTQKMIEQKMNQLTRRMQSITAMITQLATMMSNLSKMYSDIAMNSIRNMK